MKRTILALALIALLASRQKVEQASTEQAPADKVAKAMAAADITLPEVAAYLHGYGYTVLPEQLAAPHWRPATGSVNYYIVTMRVAVADTVLRYHVANSTSSPLCAWVQAVGPGGISQRSLVGWSDNGNGSNALPGVGVLP